MNKEEYIAILEVDVAELRNKKEQLKEQLKIKEDGFNATISELCDVSEKLQQRDEVIDEAKEWIKEYIKEWANADEVEKDMKELLDILKKAKGDSNEVYSEC